MKSLLFMILMMKMWSIIRGELHWYVSEKVTDYGQTATLLCLSDLCNSQNCSFRAGWDIYDPDFKPFAVVKKQYIPVSAKYIGKIVKEGFTLEIRNLSKEDVDINYECSVSYHRSKTKILQKTDLFRESRYEGFLSKEAKRGLYLKVVEVSAIGISVFIMVVIIIVLPLVILRRKASDQIKNSTEDEQSSLMETKNFKLTQSEIEDQQNDGNVMTTQTSTSVAELEKLKKSKILEHEACISKIDEKINEISKLEREKYNKEIESKGNIRVFCRVRPTKTQSVNTAIKCTKYAVTVLEKIFEMDGVFSEGSTQTEVFDEVKPLVTSCLHGFNVCIFAYGQTGAGKTYTMEGNNDNPGLYNNFLDELFKQAKDEQSLTFTFTVCFLEIYKEKLRSLLDNDKNELKVMFVEDVATVKDLEPKTVSTPKEVKKVLSDGSKNRKTCTTNMNVQSSRSHALLILTVEAKKKSTGNITRGKLTLVDLAGSESVKNGPQGTQREEAIKINLSLFNFKKVLCQLKQNEPYIGYQESLLTKLLKGSLGGDSKAVMILNVAPEEENAFETKKGLEFGKLVRSVELRTKKQN